MLLPIIRTRSLVVVALSLLLTFALSTKGITVSGRVTESDTGPIEGVRITVEQIGGEFLPLTALTDRDGNWSVTDPLLTGNIRATPSSGSFTFSPPSRDSFTFANLGNQDFTATPTIARANIGVSSGRGGTTLNGGSQTFTVIGTGRASSHALGIHNEGTVPLHNISITVTGAPPGEFSVLLAPPTDLEPNGSTFAVLQIIPAAAGVRSATVLIHSDDPNENPFVVHLSGLVVSLEVMNTADSGPGSLRQAILNTVVTENLDTIRFHPSLSGQTIRVSNEIPVTALGTVVIDATSLPAGVTLDGGGVTRILRTGGNTLKLLGLTFKGGNPGSVNPKRSGGAVLAEGPLFVSGCTFSNNVSHFKGGAIATMGEFSNLTLSNCTFVNNTGPFGGAVGSDAKALISQCTFAGNSGRLGGGLFLAPGTTITRSTITGNRSNTGGAISFDSVLTLNHCTIVDNTANSSGGLFSQPAGTVNCNFTILARNQAMSTSTGFAVLNNRSSILTEDPLLAPLDDYGGPTKTMALLPGSPARDAATNSTSNTDQRGFPIVGARDIGAYESGTDSNFNAFIWEHLPASATAAQHDAAVDFDGDGADNLSEWLALTDPADASSHLRITRIVAMLANGVEISFQSSLERHYQIETSTNLIDWLPEGSLLQGTGTVMTVPLVFPNDESQRFIRIRAIR